MGQVLSTYSALNLGDVLPTSVHLWEVFHKLLMIMSPPAVVVAEWLRRWTRNPLGSPRAGSNPADNDRYCNFRGSRYEKKASVKCSLQAQSHTWAIFRQHWKWFRSIATEEFITSSCRGREVKAMDSKSIGVSPRRFESCRQRWLIELQSVLLLKGCDVKYCWVWTTSQISYLLGLFSFELLLVMCDVFHNFFCMIIKD